MFKILNQFLPRKNLILYQTTVSRIIQSILYLESSPSSLRYTPLFPAEQSKLDTFLTENLCTGWIYLHKSPMAALVFSTNKKNSSLHLVQDYRSLNIIMVKNKYPLLLSQSEILYKIGYQLRFQHCPNQVWRWVESCITHQLWFFWASSNVLWYN